VADDPLVRGCTFCANSSLVMMCSGRTCPSDDLCSPAQFRLLYSLKDEANIVPANPKIGHHHTPISAARLMGHVIQVTQRSGLSRLMVGGTMPVSSLSSSKPFQRPSRAQRCPFMDFVAQTSVR
jgi:hypothetical protein